MDKPKKYSEEQVRIIFADEIGLESVKQALRNEFYLTDLIDQNGVNIIFVEKEKKEAPKPEDVKLMAAGFEPSDNQE